MQSSGSIKEAILDQAKEEAQKILLEARRKAEQILKNTEEEKRTKLEENRQKAVEEANRESERIRTKANIEAKKITTERKMTILAKITEEAKKKLSERKTGYEPEEAIKMSLTEGLPMFSENEKLHIYVNPRDVNFAKKALKDLNLSASIAVEPNDNILGGVIMESWDHRVRFDNSYESRLNSYVEKHLSEIAKALFES